MINDSDDEKIVDEELGRMRLAKMLKPNGGGRRNTQASTKSQFLELNQVLELIPVGRTTLYQMIKEGEFPKQINLTNKRVAWSKKEVQAWIDKKLN